MMLVAEHGWCNEPVGSFQWIGVSEGMPQPLREALEPYSGYPWLHHGDNPPVTWSMRVINAGGVRWHVLTTGRADGCLPDGRPLRRVRHMVLDRPAPMGPGRHLALDDAGTGVGDDSSLINATATAPVDWSACGGDWTGVFAKRIAAGLTLRVILPPTATAMDWWLAIEGALDATLWQRTILLELLPDETGAQVVLAVDGTPCAEAMRASGRAVLDLARAPARPPDEAPVEATADTDAIADPAGLPIPDVQLTPGGPPVGLAALAVLALVLIAGVIVAVLWAIDSGTAM